MLESKLQIFFGKFAIYIIAFFVATSAVFGGGWYVTAYKLDSAINKERLVETQLEVSNASFKSIKDQFALLTKTLEANQEKALASHALLQEKLSQVVESDKTKIQLEQDLLKRQPTTDCKTPEDLKNAWSKL